jgi:hypothetical protein
MLRSVKEWLSRFVARLRTNREPEVAPKNEIEELIEKWLAIEPSKVNGVFSSDMSIFSVQICKNTVREYVKYLEMINQHFRQGVDLKPVTLVFQGSNTYLRDFFVNEKGYYLDPGAELIELRKSVIAFLELYEKARSVHEKTFEQQRNLSLTSQLIGELTQLAEVFKL